MRGKTSRRVGDLLEELSLEPYLRGVLERELGRQRGTELLQSLKDLPLLASHALTRLGSYRWYGSDPLSIRLQFAQEPELLRQTLLHEVAHFLDHQTRPDRSRYRQPHGDRWQHWYRLIGGRTDRSASPVLSRLRQQRLKPVARCRRCGVVIERLRRLPRGRRWLHAGCGGALVVLDMP